MPKILVFYWEPGSGGDFVTKLLLERPLEYQGVIEKTTFSAQGRVSPQLKTFFVENFSSPPRKWYFRDWTVADCNLLTNFVNNLDCEWFVLPTHRLDQLDFLKSQFDNSISMGITYPKNMFPLVLKNWCKKIAAFEPGLQNIYNKPLHQYLILKNKFGEFVLTEQLTYGTRIKHSVENTFDIDISLENIYNLDLSSIKSMFCDDSHVDCFFNDWLLRQSKLHSHCYDIPDILKNALGYNSKSKNFGDLSESLDTFDNLLIRHHCSGKDIPYFKTLQQASNFLINT